MHQYFRKAHYHETDQMGIIHHSNYVKWLEEARIHSLAQMGISYADFENDGIFSPVTEINVEYKKPVKHGEEVIIEVKIAQYTGVRLSIEYLIKDSKTQEIRSQAFSKHCFIDKNGSILSLKRTDNAKKYDEKLQADLKKFKELV